QRVAGAVGGDDLAEAGAAGHADQVVRADVHLIVVELAAVADHQIVDQLHRRVDEDRAVGAGVVAGESAVDHRRHTVGGDGGAGPRVAREGAVGHGEIAVAVDGAARAARGGIPGEDGADQVHGGPGGDIHAAGAEAAVAVADGDALQGQGAAVDPDAGKA